MAEAENAIELEGTSPERSGEMNPTGPDPGPDPGPSVDSISSDLSRVGISSGTPEDDRLNPDTIPPSNSKIKITDGFRGTVRQFNEQLELHKAFESLDVVLVSRILKECKEQNVISNVINHRNGEGTNPVGMAFLNPLQNRNAIQIATVVVSYDEYNINDYLNNKRFMDSWDPANIGGTTLLHNVALVAAKMNESIVRSLTKFFDALNVRLIPTEGVETRARLGPSERGKTCATFHPNFPSQHPDKLEEIGNAHLNSASVIVERLSFKSANVKKTFSENLKKLIDRFEESEKKSANENSAIKDQNMLLKLQSFVEHHLGPHLNKEELALDENHQRLFDRFNSEFAILDGKFDQGQLIKLCEELNENRAGNKGRKVLENSKLEKLKKMRVPFFHGVPLMQSMYTNSDRGKIRDVMYPIIEKLMNISDNNTNNNSNINNSNNNNSNNNNSNNNDDNRQELTAKEKTIMSVHSRTATASAGFQTLVDLISASEDKLKEIEVIENKIEEFLAHPEDPITTNLALKEFVFNFATFNTKKLWKNLRGRETHESVVKYRAPIVSTSKTPDHAMKFAIGQNVEEDKGEVRLLPHYEQSQPGRRLAGFMFISWLSLEEVAERLENGTLVDVNQRFSKENNLSWIQHQNECAFLGSIDSSSIVGVVPIVFPDFSKITTEKNSEFYQFFTGVFGINPEANKKWLTSPPKIQVKLDKNPDIAMGGEASGVLRLLYHSYANLANGVLTAAAKKEEKILVTFQRNQNLIPYNVTWIHGKKASWSQAKKDIEEGLPFSKEQPLWKELCREMTRAEESRLVDGLAAPVQTSEESPAEDGFGPEESQLEDPSTSAVRTAAKADEPDEPDEPAEPAEPTEGSLEGSLLSTVVKQQSTSLAADVGKDRDGFATYREVHDKEDDLANSDVHDATDDEDEAGVDEEATVLDGATVLGVVDDSDGFHICRLPRSRPSSQNGTRDEEDNETSLANLNISF